MFRNLFISRKKKRRIDWYHHCARLPRNDFWSVNGCTDFPEYECVTLRDTKYLSAVMPVPKIDFRGRVNGLYVIGYKKNKTEDTPTHVRLRDLQSEIERVNSFRLLPR